MARRARVGSGSSGGGGNPAAATSEFTMSGYGNTRLNSVGYNIKNPYSRSATQEAKTYTPKATAFSTGKTAYGQEGS